MALSIRVPPSLPPRRSCECGADESALRTTPECDLVCTACGVVASRDPISPTRGIPFCEDAPPPSSHSSTRPGVRVDFRAAKRRKCVHRSFWSRDDRAFAGARQACARVASSVSGEDESRAYCEMSVRDAVANHGGDASNEVAARRMMTEWTAAAGDSPRDADVRMAIAASCAISMSPWEARTAVSLGTDVAEIADALDARASMENAAARIYDSLRPASSKGSVCEASVRDAIDQVLDRRSDARARGTSFVLASVALTFALEMRKVVRHAKAAHSGRPEPGPFALIPRSEMVRRDIERARTSRACTAEATKLSAATSNLVGTVPETVRDTIAAGLVVAAVVLARDEGAAAGTAVALAALRRMAGDSPAFSAESLRASFCKVRDKCARRAAVESPANRDAAEVAARLAGDSKRRAPADPGKPSIRK